MSLRSVVRECVLELNNICIDDETSIQIIIQKLKNAGAVKRMHVGGKNLSEKQTIEWYAGQIISSLEGSRVGINAIINCLDRYAPNRPDEVEVIAVAVAGPTDDHTCVFCGNTKCSTHEKSCWKCGNPITK